ncbi:3-oxo-5-alpha-steroid 4-dehydrogenase [Plectosphaerella cucumerina]|uniref:3-oxo-5-alpha-steroid 4-dehydrogenase n=1 Tax=Plectosphaerella cucumerina TaxID=40658 RepID=A0A8K0TPC6_9PEZI|nr:3-oxo-5-alpha-steroid 4-dehydrogenase [Plectosphaerella cucumerina]
MAIIQDWLPPTRENYETILTTWKYLYPVIGALQAVIPWYGMGKTSVVSKLNFPGRLGWLLMEIPGFTTLLYVMRTLPAQPAVYDLPWQNKVLAGLFVLHYSYRAVAYPFLQPSMSPIHLGVALMAAGFQVLNGTCLGAWLGGYGPTSEVDWAARAGLGQFVAGIGVFYVGLVGNYFHDEELREVRRERARLAEGKEGAKGVEKHYAVPEGMLFRYMLYPHYFCEWVEWFGFWMATGWCVPARTFLVNELFGMVPRVVRGRWWYEERFGREAIRKKWMAVPGLF